jgi:molecular chaperone HtpG
VQLNQYYAAKVEYGNPIIEVKIKEGKKLHFIDQGIGMTC